MLLAGRSLVAWLLNLAVTYRYSGTQAEGGGAAARSCKPLLVPPENSRVRLILLARCTFGLVELCGGYFALSELSGLTLPDASALLLLAPVFSFAIGRVVLKESLHAVHLCAGLVSLAGAVFVTRPTVLFGSSRPSDAAAPATGNETAGEEGHSVDVGILAALGSAAASAFAYACVRSPSLRVVSAPVVVHWFALSATWVPFLIAAIVGVAAPPRSTTAWLAVLGMGGCSVVGQLLMTWGMQREAIGPVTTLRYTDIVFVFIWDAIFVHERVDVTSYIGSFLIVVGCVMIAVQKGKDTRQPDIATTCDEQVVEGEDEYDDPP